ncbi:MAG: ATP-binding protein [Dehalococcoidales bacterium]|nr:ATP-binding protein [Dehalococcoidales bacterium]
MKRQSQIKTGQKLLSAIDDISRILISDKEIESKLRIVLDYLIRESEIIDTGFILITDPSDHRLIAQCLPDIDINSLKQLKLHSGTDMISRVYQTGKAELYPKEKSKTNSRLPVEKILGLKISGLISLCSIICLPLIKKEKKYGIITFLKLNRESRFNEDSLVFFRVIANLITGAIENTALCNDLKYKDTLVGDDRYKAALIPTLAHEIRTPLTSIKGYSTALLMEEANFTPETQREFLEIIDKECDVLENLVSDYLESSIIDAGVMRIDFQPVRLQNLAVKAADEMRHRFRNYTLLVDFPHDFPLVDADPERILQVIRQLLDNAVKYSPKGGLIILQGKVIKEHAVISIADEGVGIAPEDLNHLFDRFFRAKSNSENQVIGTGLGLPISRAIIEAHGGRIWAESVLGQGSRFYFSLPLKGLSQKLED